MSNMSLKWIEGSPDKFEVGMLVVTDDGVQLLIGNTDENAERGLGNACWGIEPSNVIRWTYLIRDYELNWHFEMMKGKK